MTIQIDFCESVSQNRFVPGDFVQRAAATSAGGFHTTHWTVVLEAARADRDTCVREALASLCSTYWLPLYSFIRRQGTAPHEAEDLTQEFFCRFLERNSLANVRPAGGKFRSFLLVCLKNFLANERERAHAQRRGGDRLIVPLDNAEAETHYSLEPVEDRTPEAIFDRRWAFVLLDQTINELRDEYKASGKQELFDDLEGLLPGGRPAVSREELAAKRGVSVGAVDVAIHRLRKRFGALLRKEVLRTVSSESEVEEELRYLRSILAS